MVVVVITILSVITVYRVIVMLVIIFTLRKTKTRRTLLRLAYRGFLIMVFVALLMCFMLPITVIWVSLEHFTAMFIVSP